ncbi:MAG: alpha/beta hydrolase [Myxococcota bacterium]|nr:alpha/beta hydrolase [Myxococcota bacterium]
MHRWIDHDHEVSIAVQETGLQSRSGLPVLWVHGFAHQSQVWNDVIQLTDLNQPMLQMDLRGHGASGWSVDADYGVAQHARDIHRVLDALEIEHAILVAHSLGGNAALLAAADAPQRFSALALIDTGPGLSFQGLQQVAHGVSESLRSYDCIEDFRATLDHQYPLAAEASLDALAKASLVRRIDGRYEARLDPALLRDQIPPALLQQLEQDLWAALSNIKVPTLIVRGAASGMLSEETVQSMTEQIAGPTHHVTVPGSGHSIMLDAPGPLAACLREFISGHQPSTTVKCSSIAASQAPRFSSWG